MPEAQAQPYLDRAHVLWWEKRFFHWELEFPEVFFDRYGRRKPNPGFDAVVGNPPWGTPARHLSYWRKYALATGQFDYWNLFTELSVGLCRTGGYHSFVVPDSIVQPEHKITRKHLLENTVPTALVRIGEGSFESIFRAAFIYCLQNKLPEIECRITTLQLNKRQRDELELKLTTLENLDGIFGEAIESSWFSERHGFEFELGLSKADRDIMIQMEQHALDWNELVWDGRGVELGKEGLVIRCPHCKLWMPIPRGFDRDFARKVSCRHCGEDLRSSGAVRRAQIVGPKPLNEYWKPFIIGEAVNRYHLSSILYIDTSFAGINYKDESFYLPPKLLVRKTGVGIYATIDYTHALTNQVVFIFRKLPSPSSSVENVSLEYIVGVISSRLMLYYYAQRYGEKEWRSFPYVTQRIIKTLPVPNPFVMGEEAVYLHDQITKLVKQALEANGPISESHDIEIEELVTEIYGLNSRQVSHMYDALGKMQRLRIVRELLPQG